MANQKIKDEYKAISEVQEKDEDTLLVKGNVVGLGVGHKITGERDTGKPCLTVFVSQKLKDPAMISVNDMIPGTIRNVATDVVETGDIFAENLLPTETEEQDVNGVGIEVLRGRLRPVEGGYSIGHYRITAGTYATAVYDAKPYPGIPRKYYALSNNHVLANSNNAKIGDPILQPGPYDGGQYPGDLIARLSRYVPMRFGGQANYVDAAIAEGQFHDLDREIFWIGYVKGVGVVKVGSDVQKTGRTTSYTTGRVMSINATVNVNYGSSLVARMVRQIVTTNMSAGGDSGSLLCDMNENAVGLLFAGSSSVSIHNDIRYVQQLLGIRVI